MKLTAPLAQNLYSVTPPPPTNVLVGLRSNLRPTTSGVPRFPSLLPAAFVRSFTLRARRTAAAAAYLCLPSVVSGATPETLLYSAVADALDKLAIRRRRVVPNLRGDDRRPE